jgi:lipid-binding SYLF domain-containing protein
MKLFKTIIAVMLLSVIVFSCKKEKKEESVPVEVVEVEDESASEAIVEEDAIVEDATEKAAEEAVDEAAIEEAVSEETEISVIYPKDKELEVATAKAIKSFIADNPSLEKYFDKAYGFAVLPVITKGGLGIGGAAGKGLVFENKVVKGMTKMTQATIGAQAGGQKYMEVIYFENKASLDNFTGGKLKFSGQASAIALEKGTAVDMKYKEGVAIFTKGIGGLMAEASVGGQKFKYHPGL